MGTAHARRAGPNDPTPPVAPTIRTRWPSRRRHRLHGAHRRGPGDTDGRGVHVGEPVGRRRRYTPTCGFASSAKEPSWIVGVASPIVPNTRVSTTYVGDPTAHRLHGPLRHVVPDHDREPVGHVGLHPAGGHRDVVRVHTGRRDADEDLALARRRWGRVPHRGWIVERTEHERLHRVPSFPPDVGANPSAPQAIPRLGAGWRVWRVLRMVIRATGRGAEGAWPNCGVPNDGPRCSPPV